MGRLYSIYQVPTPASFGQAWCSSLRLLYVPISRLFFSSSANGDTGLPHKSVRKDRLNTYDCLGFVTIKSVGTSKPRVEVALTPAGSREAMAEVTSRHSVASRSTQNITARVSAICLNASP